MIQDVTFENTTYHGAPARIEAGTGNIADAVGLGAAIDYIEHIGLDNIGRYEHALLEYATHRLQEIPNLRIMGTAPQKASVISLVIKGVPSEEVGARLNNYGIAVRSGHLRGDRRTGCGTEGHPGRDGIDTRLIGFTAAASRSNAEIEGFSASRTE